MRKIQSSLLLFVFSASLHAQPVLEQVASITDAGQFTLFNQAGDGSGYSSSFTQSGAGSGGIFTFTYKAVFDTTRQRVYHFAAGHNGGFGWIKKFITYDIPTGLWSQRAEPQWALGMGGNFHSYGLEAIMGGNYFRFRANLPLVYACDIDKDSLDDIGGANCPGDYPDPVAPPSGLYRGSLEPFPDRNSLFYFDEQTGRVREKPLDGAWITHPYQTTLGSFDGVAAVYSHASHEVLFGCGARTTQTGTTYNQTWYAMSAAGVITPIDPVPVTCYAAGSSLVFEDPESGKIVLIRPNAYPPAVPTGFFVYELDRSQPAGMQWVRREDIEPNVPQLYGGGNGVAINYLVGATVAVPISGPNVVLLAGWRYTWLYRHTAPPPPPPPPPDDPLPPPDPPTELTFEEKCKQPGVLACWPFDDPAELRYSWDLNSAALNTAMAGQRRYGISRLRIAGEGNTGAVEHPSGALSIPVIDKEVFASGVGSLRMNIPSQSGASSGGFQDNYNKILGNPSIYISPTSPHGSKVYLQFMFRVNDAMLDTRFQQSGYLFNLTTPAAGSTTINAGTGSFNSTMVGRKIAVSTTGNWRAGFYTITAFNSDRSVTVDRSPTPTGPGSALLAMLSGAGLAGGWKTIIQFGNSPTGASSSGLEITQVNGNQKGFPVMYGQQGYDGPGQIPLVEPFVRNRFQQMTIEIETAGLSGEKSNTVRWYVDGKLVWDWPNAKANFADGYGFGQFFLSCYHTRKDPTQEHEPGYCWYDDVIVSTQPIQKKPE